MTISLQKVGKKFNKEWIFRNISFEFVVGKYSVLGTNGSGKSTLLQIIAGSASPSEGEIKYGAEAESFFRNVSYAAPYLELPEEMTWKEAVHFHGRFKGFVSGFTENKIIELSGLIASGEKQIRNFSSGMKQRAKLTLAILSDTPVLLLDEPATNLDEHAIKWYQQLLSEFGKEKLVIVCSNYNKEEYAMCAKSLVLGA